MSTRRYFKELRLQQFRALMEVGRKGTFTAAAEALQLSRTSVWQQIRSLEDDFGVELVVVRGHQSKLTADGMLLFQMIEPIVDGFDTVKSAFQDRIGKLHRRLVVATTSSLINHELRKTVEFYRKSHTDVSLSLIDRPSLAALELLAHGEADVAIVGSISTISKNSMLKSQPLTHYPFILACPKKHPLSAKPFNLSDLAKYPLILPSVGTNSRQRIDDVFGKAGISEHIQLALDSHNAGLLLSYVEQDLGIALSSMSPLLIEQYSKRLSLRDVCDVFGKEEVLLVQREQRYPLGHVMEFVELVLKTVEKSI